MRVMSSGGSIIKIPKKVVIHTRKQFEYEADQRRDINQASGVDSLLEIAGQIKSQIEKINSKF